MRAAWRSFAVAVFAMTATAAPAQVLTFADLDGWADDDHQAALAVFLDTCDALTDPDWVSLCRFAGDAGQTHAGARSFFELFFKPVIMGDPPALFTGYYEPELAGSPVRTPNFAYPIYRKPPELADGAAWHTREAIETQGLLRGRGLEIAWLDDPVEVYFLMIQGSGRIRMPDGSAVRVGYGGKNNQPYRSIGQEMIRRGLMTESDASAQSIRAFVRQNPAMGAELLTFNPSFVFFKKLPDLPASKGPIGAIGRSISTLRSIAVDPEFTPLGAPVWVEKDGERPIRSLMIAQDTGGAIKGPQRADIFYGTGRGAGEAAGAVKDGGRMVVLLPIDRAYAMVEGD
jgi:membrane-bound lytic murein transglycosylase A